MVENDAIVIKEKFDQWSKNVESNLGGIKT